MNAKKFSEEILAILDGSLPEDKRKELLDALYENEALRNHLASHVAFKAMLKMSSGDLSVEAATDAHVDDETLGAFVETSLEPKEAEVVKAHLRTCSDCFLRMAALAKSIHTREDLSLLKTPANFVEKAKRLLPTPEEFVADAKNIPAPQSAGIKHAIVGLIEKIRQWLEPIPAWGYGLAAVAVSTVVLFMLLKPESSIVNFSLGNHLTIFDAGPMGFINEQETIEYKGMEVFLSADSKSLIFKWPAIPEAMFYEITLIEEAEKRKITPLGGVLENTFSFSKHEVTVGVKYVWELSGKLKNGKGFTTRGSFVCIR